MISIVVPVYNVEQYVGRCITSIIDQERCSARLECIVIDDCSPDNSMSIVHSLVDDSCSDISFVFFKHERNEGLSAARNTGINLAKGEYIMFVDSDDWIPKDTISKFFSIMKNNPDIDLVAGNYYKVKEKSPQPITITKPTFMNNYQLRKGFLNDQNVSCTAWNKLIRTSIVNNHRFHVGIIFEDNCWAYSLFKDITKAVVIPDETYIYENDHPFSITNTAESRQKAVLHIHSINILGNEILESPYQDLYVDSIIFLLGFLITALRLQKKYSIEDKECFKLYQLRKRCISLSLTNGRRFLGFFVFLLTYPPTAYMFNLGWFRHHYHIIAKTGKRIACFEDRFCKSLSCVFWRKSRF